jgi:hypothetical protein
VSQNEEHGHRTTQSEVETPDELAAHEASAVA